ncbi:M20 peptidase aminoacylase family protein [Cytobacillus sp. FJAT-53684]|uniref:M20 peptidase aminoacylase family protein n=1 Tax=Cytobacillus mangrovibacter TaxID=3299024 RepID=A0ABW6K6S2_9BACI
MKEIIEDSKKEIIEIFNQLHNNPEISWHEYETTEFLKNYLERYECKVTTFDDCTGVVGEIGEGSPVVAIRADIDGLLQEVDGVVRANHSCGHDAHMTMVLGVLLLFKKMSTIPRGTLRFIFQPAEEKGTGALKMVEKGVVDNVDYLFGVLLRSEEDIKNGEASPSVIHSASRFIEGKIRGADAHGSRPHISPNAIEVASTIIQALSHIRIDPMIPHSIKMTKIEAGGNSPNIIPGNASFSLDLRVQKNRDMDLLTKKVKHVIENIARVYNVEISLNITGNLPAAEVDSDAEQIIQDAIIDTLDQDKLKSPIITPKGEDFHYYTLKRPYLKATVLGLGCGLKPDLHHPNMTFDKEAIFSGIEILTRAAITALSRLNSLSTINR